MASAQFNVMISRLRRDNGTKYTSNEFTSFCKDKGIVNEFTVPYTPEQNGVSERMNRKIVEKARTMYVDILKAV
jgi:transposase InsO family protein